MFGNRGCLHDDRRTVVRRFKGRMWLSCRLHVSRVRAQQRDDNRAFNGRKRVLMTPRRYTGAHMRRYTVLMTPRRFTYMTCDMYMYMLYMLTCDMYVHVHVTCTCGSAAAALPAAGGL